MEEQPGIKKAQAGCWELCTNPCHCRKRRRGKRRRQPHVLHWRHKRWPLAIPTHHPHTQQFCSFWLVCNTTASSYWKLPEHKHSLPFCTHSDIITAKLGESHHVLTSPSTSKHLPSTCQHLPSLTSVSPQSTFTALSPFHMSKGMQQAGPRVMESCCPLAGTKDQETCRSPNLCPKIPPNRGTDSPSTQLRTKISSMLPTFPARNQGLNQAGNYAIGSKRNSKALLSLRGGF